MLPSKSCKTINANFLLKNFGLTFFDRFKTGTYLVNWFGRGSADRTLPNLQVRRIPMPMPVHRSFTSSWAPHLIAIPLIAKHLPSGTISSFPHMANLLKANDDENWQFWHFSEFDVFFQSFLHSCRSVRFLLLWKQLRAKSKIIDFISLKSIN